MKHDVTADKLLNTLPSFMHPLFSLYLDKFPPSLLKSPDEIISVHVIPFSHTDPGWLFSKSSYYQGVVKEILDVVVENLYKESDTTFIWTENIFLKEWFEESLDDQRTMLLELVKTGRFEINYPGFVMQDEALPDLRESLSNFMSGALWLKNFLNASVRSAFLADPFGVTSSCAYLQSLFNVSDLYVQRINYREKELLASNKNLEFWWKSGYRNSNVNMLTSLNPFKLYSVPYSCGPDPRKCCAFDFWRNSCDFHFPWEMSWTPEEVEETLSEHVHLLAEQLHLKSSLYRTSQIPFLLGDDFRYSSQRTWKKQIGNYRRIMEIFSENPSYKIQMKFSTLRQYFNSIRKTPESSNFINFHGDFVPYTDRWSEFWSGYYTTRPFLKNAGNRLSRLIFAIENIISFCIPSSSCKFVHRYNETFEKAKDLASNFLHHDLITGTARKHVVKDHRTSLLKLESQLLHSVLPAAVSELTSLHLEILKKKQPSSMYAILNDDFTIFRGPIFLRPEGSLSDCMDVIAWSPYTHGSRWVKIDSFVDKDSIIIDEFDLEPMSVTLMKIVKRSSDCINDVPNTKDIPVYQDFTLFNTRYKLSFSSSQLSKIRFSKNEEKSRKIKDRDKVKKMTFEDAVGELDISVNFETFGTFVKPPLSYISNPSGAYIFTYDGTRRNLSNSCKGQNIVRNNLLHSFRSSCQTASVNYTLYQNEQSVAGSVVTMDVGFDITEAEFADVELAIVIRTGLQSRLGFYTDSNGMFPVKRQYRSKLSLPGNVYPISTFSQITDGITWVTVTTEHARGVTSTANGELVLFLDRRHQHDDWRGLNEGINDNEYMTTKLWLSVSQTQTDGIWLSHYLRSSPVVMPIKSNKQLLTKPNVATFPQNIFFTEDETLRRVTEKKKCKKYSDVNVEPTWFACQFRIVQIYNYLQTNSTFYTIQRLPLWLNAPHLSYCNLRLNFGALQQQFDDFHTNFQPKFFNTSKHYDLQIFKLAC